MIKEFILQNWALFLILLAFVILLRTTAFLNKKKKTQMYILSGVLLLLSIIVFFEFYLEGQREAPDVRLVLMCIRYSATPYKCAAGYSYYPNGTDSIEDMLKESDEKMYADKSAFYAAKAEQRI